MRIINQKCCWVSAINEYDDSKIVVIPQNGNPYFVPFQNDYQNHTFQVPENSLVGVSKESGGGNVVAQYYGSGPATNASVFPGAPDGSEYALFEFFVAIPGTALKIRYSS